MSQKQYDLEQQDAKQYDLEQQDAKQYDLEQQDAWERYERGEINYREYHREMCDIEAEFYDRVDEEYPRW